MKIPRWWIINFWPFCRHRSWSWFDNIYGDEIRMAGYKRSWWRCDSCGLQKLRPFLGGPNYGNGDGLSFHDYTGRITEETPHG